MTRSDQFGNPATGSPTSGAGALKRAFLSTRRGATERSRSARYRRTNRTGRFYFRLLLDGDVHARLGVPGADFVGGELGADRPPHVVLHGAKYSADVKGSAGLRQPVDCAEVVLDD